MSKIEKHKIFQAEVEFIPEMRNWIVEQMKVVSLPTEFITDIKCAVSEALTNIVQYAYQAQTQRPIEITVSVYKDKIMVAFQDFGPPGDFANYLPPDLTNPAEGGYGIFLMHKLMDGICYQFTDSGTLLRMWKTRSSDEEEEE